MKQPFVSLELLRVGAAAALLASSACAANLYELPPPPPEGEWGAVSLIPGEDEKASQRRYIDARAAALQLYAALKGERWEEVWGLLSSETQAALAVANPEQDGKAALASGSLTFTGGAARPFNPLEALMVPELKTFEDTLPKETEAETDQRKELYAIDRDGHHRKLVMILEQGQWKLHRTQLL